MMNGFYFTMALINMVMIDDFIDNLDFHPLISIILPTYNSNLTF